MDYITPLGREARESYGHIHLSTTSLKPSNHGHLRLRLRAGENEGYDALGKSFSSPS